MAELKTIDARGLSCPEPALLTEQALSQLTSGIVEVFVDSATARHNITRLAQKAGWKVEVEEKPGGDLRLILTK